MGGVYIWHLYVEKMSLGRHVADGSSDPAWESQIEVVDNAVGVTQIKRFVSFDIIISNGIQY